MDHPLVPFQFTGGLGRCRRDSNESPPKANEATPVKAVPNTTQIIGPMTPQQSQSTVDFSALTPVTQVMSCRKSVCVRATPTGTPQAFVPSKLFFEGASAIDSSQSVKDVDRHARTLEAWSPLPAVSKTPTWRKRLSDSSDATDRTLQLSTGRASPSTVPKNSDRRPKGKVASFGALTAAGMTQQDTPDSPVCKIRPEILSRTTAVGTMMTRIHSSKDSTSRRPRTQDSLAAEPLSTICGPQRKRTKLDCMLERLATPPTV